MRQIFLVLFMSIAVAACSTPPEKLTNFEDQSMRRFDNIKLSIEEVQMDIRQAAAKTGWEVEPGVLPGHIKATHKGEDKAKAVVDIAYDVNKYSISYKSSEKMGYMDSCKSSKSGSIEHNCIDPKYNAWVTELNDAISHELQD